MWCLHRSWGFGLLVACGGCPLSNTLPEQETRAKELCFPSHSQEEQIVTKFSTLKWVSVGCSACLSWKKALRVGGESDIEDSAVPVPLSDPLTMPSDLKIATTANLLWLKTCQIIPSCSVALSYRFPFSQKSPLLSGENPRWERAVSGSEIKVHFNAHSLDWCEEAFSRENLLPGHVGGTC